MYWRDYVSVRAFKGILINIAIASFLALVLGAQAAKAQESERPDYAICDLNPLLKVVLKNNVKKLNKFFEKNPDFDVSCRFSNGNGILLLSGSHRRGGTPKVVPELIRRGADVNAVNIYGQSPFLVYSQYGYLDDDRNPLKKLVEAGADVHLVDNSGFGAVHYASLTHNLRSLRLLSRYGVDLNTLTNEGSSARDVAEFSARARGLQASTRLGEANLQYYNYLMNLEARNIRSMNRFNGYKLTKSDGAVLTGPKAKPARATSGIAGLLNRVIVRSEGTGKKCRFVIVVMNGSGMNLFGQFQARLENGRYQEYGAKSGGRFTLRAGAIAQHRIWLTQGGSQRLFLSAGGSGSRSSYADYIDFDVSPECPHSERSLSSKSFVVERNNANSSLSIYEDKDGDGRRDKPQSVAAARNSELVDTSQCAKIDLLATKLNADSSAMLYSDGQLDALYSAVNCSLNESVFEQRDKIKRLLGGS